MPRDWPTRLLTLAGLAVLGLAGWLFLQGQAWHFWLGLALAAGAPLVFVVLGQHRRPATGHPVFVSVALGLGSVFTLVGVQRFGDQFRWITVVALLLLVAWMLYQRYSLRQRASSADR